MRDMGAHGGKGDPPALVEFCRRMHPQLVGKSVGAHVCAEERLEHCQILIAPALLGLGRVEPLAERRHPGWGGLVDPLVRVAVLPDGGAT